MAHLEDAAREAAGNWKKFQSFAWHDKPDDAENWAIIYTSNRDSGLLDQSNAAVIDKEMSQFPEDQARSESHGHWAVGHVDGWAVRVYFPDGTITPAFKAMFEMQAALADYPVLDSEDYSRREYEATLENIEQAGRRFVRPDAPESWPSDVYSWLSDNDQGAIENQDDQGGYPNDDEIKEALEALGLLEGEEEEVGEARRMMRSANDRLLSGKGPYYGGHDTDLEILLDVAKPRAKRNGHIAPGMSVVYDRHYKSLSDDGFIRWVQVHAHHQSLADDHYVLTDKGKKAVEVYRDYVRRIGTAAPRMREPEAHQIEVVVGNVGAVYSGADYDEARRIYDEHVTQSQSGSGETVTLLVDGFIDREYGRSRSPRPKKRHAGRERPYPLPPARPTRALPPRRR